MVAGGKRIAVLVDGDAADVAWLDLELMAVQVGDGFEYADGLGTDFGADAVAGEEGNGCFHGWSLLLNSSLPRMAESSGRRCSPGARVPQGFVRLGGGRVPFLCIAKEKEP
jgi:hypothetical protein